MNHQMDFIKTTESGYDEYYCPTCEKRILMCYEPFDKIVLNQGNSDPLTTTHSGARGYGLKILRLKIRDKIDEQAEEILEDTLKDINFDGI